MTATASIYLQPNLGDARVTIVTKVNEQVISEKFVAAAQNYHSLTVLSQNMRIIKFHVERKTN